MDPIRAERPQGVFSEEADNRGNDQKERDDDRRGFRVGYIMVRKIPVIFLDGAGNHDEFRSDSADDQPIQDHQIAQDGKQRENE